ncbi:hypothetical protein V2J09_019289 [Rumex salicifolius]
MLEKLGLPAKPSLRGNNWVVDASHCQGCSSQFTFINRKRMTLRGQGDSPVRICDPCKKQEEAARSERYGHKNRAGKVLYFPAPSKAASRGADELLSEFLGGDSSGASINEDLSMRGAQNDMLKVMDDGMSIASDESPSSSPEELRQQALEEKNKYKTLKGEGKSSEALKAFKRAKELERQAAAMELQLRKSRKRALASSSISSIGPSPKTEDIPSESSRRGKHSVQKGKQKEDLNDELKALGWTETDIHEVERKPAPTSVESELLNLVGEASAKAVDKKGAGVVDKTEVVALKKKALILKREGKLAEAKEELKKAKILEKQLEEQEFLADADESDDEISALIRSMDDDKHDNSSIGYQLDSGYNFDNLAVDAVDIGIGNAIEVTDDDMYDPDLFATLKSLGWTEEPDQPVKAISKPQPVDKDRVEQEVLSLKREALTHKRAGNAAEAMSLLKRAKLLEKDLQGFESHNPGPFEKQSELEAVVVEPRSLKARTNPEPRQPPKSRIMLQKELLAMKKKALALRREGKVDEAEEELKKGKILEQQLEDMDNAPKMVISPESTHEVSLSSNQQLDISTALPSFDDEGEGDITEQDLHDPAYLTLLKSMGWQDEDKEATTSPSKLIERHDPPTLPSSHEVGNKKTKAEIQRELLGLKRKAMTLRRQGQSSEAEEVLEMAKELESKLSEMEATVKEQPVEHVPELTRTKDEVSTDNAGPASETRTEMAYPADAEATSGTQNGSTDYHSSPQQLILTHKRKALALKREGKLAEAREELKKAKQLEKALEDEEKPQDAPTEFSTPSPTPSISSTAQEELSPPNPAPKPMSSHERFKLQRECLNHKRSALKLRREGRGEEADAELQIAKTLEAQLEEASGQSQGESSKEEAMSNDVGIDDLLDPQILAALRAIGIQDSNPTPQAPSRTQPMKQPPSAPEKGRSSSQERVQLEAEIKAEKLKALNLKRSGKQAEALDSLRRAKQLEKKLIALPA